MSDAESSPSRCGISPLLIEAEREASENGLPCNLEMERETLMALLVGDAKYAAAIFDVLEPADFHGPVSAVLYAGLKDAWESGVPFNTPATLIQWLRDSGLGERLREKLGAASGDRREIEDLIYAMRSEGLAVNAEYYARTLRRLRLERDISYLLIDAIVDSRREKPADWLRKYRDKIDAMLSWAQKQ